MKVMVKSSLPELTDNFYDATENMLKAVQKKPNEWEWVMLLQQCYSHKIAYEMKLNHC